MAGRKRAIVLVSTAALLALAVACAPLRYYTQSIGGGLRVLLAREPIDRLLSDPELRPELRESLTLALDAREFAARELALPDNESYRTFVDLDREAAVWNVVAAPRFSVEPRTWCYPIVGCASYRGYFAHRRAERYAAKLASRGWDTAVTPVLAYSTLGWFADPVLSTFFRLPDWAVAGLLFHELSHQVVFVPGDTAFNESFATFVERRGVEEWLRHRRQSDRVDGEVAGALERERQFMELLLDFRACLEDRYRSVRELAARADLAAATEEKRRLFDGLGEAHALLREGWGEAAAVYDPWFSRELNNAHVASVADYGRWVPAFAGIFEESGGWGDFYRAVEELAGLTDEERRDRLEARSPSSAGGSVPVCERFGGSGRRLRTD